MTDQFGRLQKLRPGGVGDSLDLELRKKNVQLFQKIGVGLVPCNTPVEFQASFLKNDLGDYNAEKRSATQDHCAPRRAPWRHQSFDQNAAVEENARISIIVPRAQA